MRSPSVNSKLQTTSVLARVFKPFSADVSRHHRRGMAIAVAPARRHALSGFVRVNHVIEGGLNFYMFVQALFDPAAMLVQFCPAFDEGDPILARPEVHFVGRMLGLMMFMAALVMMCMALSRDRATLRFLCTGLLCSDALNCFLSISFLSAYADRPPAVAAIVISVYLILLRAATFIQLSGSSDVDDAKKSS